MKRHLGSMATVVLAFLFLPILFPKATQAHLSVIRQGRESAGTLESGDYTGSSLASGDFDGDGYEDLAIGAPNENYAGLDSAGAVVIVYGSRYGLTHERAEARTATSVGWTSKVGAKFGYAIAAGDFNADGRADLLIGAPYEKVGAAANAGSVYVLLGEPGGLGDASFGIINETNGGEIIEPNDLFGASLATGDFDHDGIDDYAIGAPGEDSNHGAVFHFWGPGVLAPPVSGEFFTQDSLGAPSDQGNMFGWSLAAGNFLGTASEDLAVGIPGRRVSSLAGAGSVVVVAGGETRLDITSWREYSALLLPGGPAANATFGKTLAAGAFWRTPRTSISPSASRGER